MKKCLLFFFIVYNNERKELLDTLINLIKITMSLMIKDIQLLKSYNKIRKKIEKLMKIDFNTKTTDGDDNKYIKKTNI